MLVSYVLLQENLSYNLIRSANILTTDAKKVVIYIVLREAIFTDVNAAAIGFFGVIYAVTFLELQFDIVFDCEG